LSIEDYLKKINNEINELNDNNHLYIATTYFYKNIDIFGSYGIFSLVVQGRTTIIKQRRFKAKLSAKTPFLFG